MTSPLRLSHPRGTRPHLVVLQGGLTAAPASFVVAPPAILRASLPGLAQVRADEADLIRCRRLVSDWR